MTILRCLWIEGANFHSNKNVNVFILHSAIAGCYVCIYFYSYT